MSPLWHRFHLFIWKNHKRNRKKSFWISHYTIKLTKILFILTLKKMIIAATRTPKLWIKSPTTCMKAALTLIFCFFSCFCKSLLSSSSWQSCVDTSIMVSRTEKDVLSIAKHGNYLIIKDRACSVGEQTAKKYEFVARNCAQFSSPIFKEFWLCQKLYKIRS